MAIYVENTHAVIVTSKEGVAAVLAVGSENRVPSIELCCCNAIVACKYAAVVTRYCFDEFVTV